MIHIKHYLHIIWLLLVASLMLLSSSSISAATTEQIDPENITIPSKSPPLSLAVFFTRPKSDPYYSLVLKFSEHVAQGFNIKINSYFSNNNHLEMTKKIKKIASSKNKPDAIAFVNFKQQDVKILKIIKKYKIPTFMFNSNPTNINNHNEYFISTISPDDEKAGYDLAKYLIEQTYIRNGEKVYITGIQGDPLSSASKLRVKGLLRASTKKNNVVLQQIVSANDWGTSTAKIKSDFLLQRYPYTNIFWAASDSIALGIHETLKKYNKQNEIIVGGIDWSTEGVEGVSNNKIAVTYGNQFMELGWVVILTYDLLVGKNKTIPKNIHSPMQMINKSNLKQRRKFTTKECWNRFDFKPLSKTLNPNLKKYQFKIKC